MRDLYFDSIEELVEGVAGFLRTSDWESLAACHNMELSVGTTAELLDAGTYWQSHENRVGHPAAMGFKYPFPPSFEFLFAEPALDDNPKTYVRVGIEIDAGGGEMQIGEQRFAVVGTPKGWQLVKEF